MSNVSFILHSNSSTSSEIQNVPTGIEVSIGNIPKKYILSNSRIQKYTIRIF